MERKSALYVATCAMIVAASLAYVYPAFAPMRALWYYPTEHRWVFELRPNGVAMDWFWRTLLAIGAGAIGFAVALTIARRLRSITPRAFALWAAWAATAVVLAATVYAYQLAKRVPTPAPLPSWYTPK